MDIFSSVICIPKWKNSMFVNTILIVRFITQFPILFYSITTGSWEVLFRSWYFPLYVVICSISWYSYRMIPSEQHLTLNVMFFAFFQFAYQGVFPRLLAIYVGCLFAINTLSLWILQYYISHNNGQLMKSVQMYASGHGHSIESANTDHSSADQRHLVAKIGCAAFEIFTDRNGKKKNLRIYETNENEQERRAAQLRKTHWWAPFWVPFNNYGIIGTTEKTYDEVKTIYEKINREEFKLKYNTSNQSCQEAAFRVAIRAILESDGIRLIRQMTTDAKIFMIMLLFYGTVIGLRIYYYLYYYDIILVLKNSTVSDQYA